MKLAQGNSPVLLLFQNPSDGNDAPCDMNNIQHSIARLEGQNRQLEETLNQMAKQSAKAVNKLEFDNQLLKAEVKQLVKNNLKLQENIKSISTAPQKQTTNTTVVSFTAYPTEARTYVEDELVLFDDTMRSYGSGYNKDLSIFQCPVSGYYLFFVSLFTSIDQSLLVRVFIDGEGVNPAVHSASTDNSASNLVVAHCDFGQLVWVKSDGIGTLQGNSRSTFTGTLLHAD